MTAYYLLMPRDDFGVAIPEPRDDEYTRRLGWALGESARLEVIRASRWTRDRETRAADWQWGAPNLPLLSAAFKDVVEETRTERDEIQWIPAILTDSGGVEQERWIPHFPGERDILDPDWTEWGPSGLPMVWFLSPVKMAGVTITTRPHVAGTLIVSGELMRALRRARLTGYRTMRARVAGDLDVG